MMRLDSICILNMGQSPDSTSYNVEKNGLPFFQGNADFGILHPTVRIWCDSPKKIAMPNDILISVRAPIGALNIADTECCIGRGLAALTVNASICINEYLWFAISSKVDELNSKGTGSTFKAISKNVLADTEIPLPPLNEQRQIADILNKVTHLIDVRKQQLSKLDELVKSRFIELFGDRWTNNHGWQQKPLSECAEFYNGKAHEQVVDKNGEYILVTSRCIASDVTDFRRTKELLFPLVIDDICMVMSDVPNGKALAKCILIDKNNKYTLNQRICCFRNYKLNKVFFYYFLNRHEYILSFDNGNSQTNMRKDDLLSCPVIIPPMELQNKFAAFVEQTDKLKSEVKNSLKKLETLKKSLMQQYFG